jgi:hypothetical protein
MPDLVDGILSLTPQIRYVAVARHGELILESAPGWWERARRSQTVTRSYS